MKTIDLESLRLEAFRSFVDPVDIPFPRRGLVLVKGVNTRTGGSSRVGKSNVNAGVAYALGYCPFPATALQSWFTDKPPSVDLRFSVGDESQYAVRRGKAVVLEHIGRDGGAVRGAKAVEARLRDVLGLDPEMLAALTYRQQGSAGTLLSKTNVETQEFLTVVLGLAPYERAVDAAQVRAKTLEDDVKKATLDLEFQEKDLERLRADVKALEDDGAFLPVDTSRTEAALPLAEQELRMWVQRRDDVVVRRREYLEGVRASKDKALKPYVDAAAAAGARLTLAKEAEHDARWRTRNTRADQAKLLSQLEAARTAKVCPTCKRPLDTDAGAVEEHVRALEVAVDGDAQDIAAADAAFVAAEQALAAARAAAVDAQERAAAESERVDAESRANTEALDRAYAVVTEKHADAVDVRRQVVAELASLREQAERRKKTEESWRKRVADAETAVADRRTRLEAARLRLNAELDFVALVGREGFLGAIFDEVLAEVAMETNAILAKVPNVNDVQLEFRSESLTGKGTVKRAITPVVTIGGHEAPLKSGCSGGMLAAVYLATDLAVIDVVSRRLGVSPGWVVLDESFDGLGPVEKEAVLDILQEYAQNKLVLVVDHGTETKEYFRCAVELRFDGERTTVVTTDADR